MGKVLWTLELESSSHAIGVLTFWAVFDKKIGMSD